MWLTSPRCCGRRASSGSLDARIPVAAEATAVAAFVTAGHLCVEQRNFGEHFLVFVLTDRVTADFLRHGYHLLSCSVGVTRKSFRTSFRYRRSRFVFPPQSLRPIVRGRRKFKFSPPYPEESCSTVVYRTMARVSSINQRPERFFAKPYLRIHHDLRQVLFVSSTSLKPNVLVVNRSSAVCQHSNPCSSNHA